MVLDELDWDLGWRGQTRGRTGDGQRDTLCQRHTETHGEYTEKRGGSPLEPQFSGFTVSRQDKRLKVADKAIGKLKDRVLELTRRIRGNHISVIVARAEENSAWLESVLWRCRSAESSARHRQMGTTQVTLLSLETMGTGRLPGTTQARRVSVSEAWNTSKSAHGPWRLSKTPALTIALPLRYFNNLGLPSLAPR